MTQRESIRTGETGPAPAPPPPTTTTAARAPVRRADPGATTASAASLLLRLALATVFFAHGAQKVLGLFGGGGFDATIEQFEQAWGLPWFATVLVMAAEFLGPVGLLLGLFTRFLALGIVAVMVGAIALVHADHGFFMNWTGQKAGEGFEFHLLAIGAALALAVLGGGRWSVDCTLATRTRAR